MRRTYLFLSLILILSGCTSLWGTKNFHDLYVAHVTSQIDSIQSFLEHAGITAPRRVEGDIALAASMPGVMSGHLRSGYMLQIDGQDLEILAKNLSLAYEALIFTGSTSVDALHMISHGGDAYFLFQGLQQSNMIPEEIVTILQKYANVWFSLKKEEMNTALSGSTQEDILASVISENLSTLTLAESKKFLGDFPIFHETQDLGMSGSLHAYAITLDRENIVNLVDTVSKRITGSGLLTEEKTTLTENLGKFEGSGTLSFDPDDAARMELSFRLVPVGADPIDIVIRGGHDVTTLSLMSLDESILFTRNSTDPQTQNIEAKLIQGSKESLIFTLKMTETSTGAKNIDATLASPLQGFSATLSHTYEKSGLFRGKLDFGLGNLSWSGNIQDHILRSLSAHGAALGNTLDLDLKPLTDTDMLTGALLLGSAGGESLRANIGLRISPTRTTLDLDIPLPKDQSDTGALSSLLHLSTDITARLLPVQKIQIPQDPRPLRELIDALDSVMVPSAPFIEGDSLTGGSDPFHDISSDHK